MKDISAGGPPSQQLPPAAATMFVCQTAASERDHFN
jgi:hypothetical protein